MRKPSLLQEWVIAKGMNYDGIVSTHSLQYHGELYSPLHNMTDSEVNKFMKRMVASGWLTPGRQESFYNLTEKAVEFMKNNPREKDFRYYEILGR